MRVHRSFCSLVLNESLKISPTLRLMVPLALRSTCWKARYSPCRSARKCSVPLGRFKIASRLMISVLAVATLGKLRDSSFKK